MDDRDGQCLGRVRSLGLAKTVSFNSNQVDQPSLIVHAHGKGLIFQGPLLENALWRFA